ncbi:hypothetical protein M1D55_19465 [Cupriavidus sp. JZ107]
MNLSITLAITLAGAVLTFAWKEPRIYLRLQRRFELIVAVATLTGLGWVAGMYFTAQAASGKLATLPQDPKAIEGAKHVMSGLTWVNDASLYVSALIVFLLLLESGATLLAQEIIRDRRRPGDQAAVMKLDRDDRD